MLEKLYYIEQNRQIPFGRVSSTARRGRKWLDAVEVGDPVQLTITGTEEVFGHAVVVDKEMLTYADVLDNADHNHVAFSDAVDKHCSARSALNSALTAAYGHISAGEFFTVLHLLPVNPKEEEIKSEPQEKFTDFLVGARQAGCTAVELENWVEGAGGQAMRYEF